MGADQLVRFWSELERKKIHAKDAEYLARRPNDFETRLVPVPWSGDLRNAKVFVLFLNPGLSACDVCYEEKHPEFVEELWLNLKGRSPYIYLRKAFCDHPGYGWARKHFGDDISEEESTKLCVLQLVPYHSAKGRVATTAASKLESSRQMKAFVHALAVEKRPLIVVRGARACGLHDRDDSDKFKRLSGVAPLAANLRRGSSAGNFLREAIRDC